MVSQTQMTGNGRPTDSGKASKHLGYVVHDVISLLELQTQLLVADCKESLLRLMIAGISLLVALFFLLGSIPILLAAFAAVLVQSTGMSSGLALLLSAVLGLLVGCGLGFWGLRSLRRIGQVFRRSGRELNRNLSWLKDALKASSATQEESERS